LIHREIQVDLGERSYPIYVGTDLASSLPKTLAHHGISRNIAVVTDTRVAGLYLHSLVKLLRTSGYEVTPVVIPTGERQKNLRRASEIIAHLLTHGIERSSAVVALGGGVIGDLAGFVAATFQRGIPLIHIPTTLLAQVDSSIGGKVAVNHPLGKNMIGAFYQPKFVWTDTDVLRSLPRREVVCGLGEIVKYGIIRDPGLFSFLEASLDDVLRLDAEAILSVLSSCCSAKADIVSQDEKESGLRMILNFGHTLGHALEAAGKFRLLKHGEAVLLGMTAETSIAQEMGLLDAAEADRIRALIARIPLRAALRSLRRTDVLKLMSHDKKSIGGRIRFVLPTRVGEVKVIDDVDARLVSASLQRLLRPALPK
jgi:3-dehydroquinate synthase